MRICLVGPFHLSSNPRLVREANLLAEAGHDVVVVTPCYWPRLVVDDQRLLARAKWRYHAIDCTGSGHARWFLARLRRRAYAALARRVVAPWVLARAGGYAFAELERVARGQRAQLYIAHTQMTLPLAVRAARDTNAAVAVDIEDLLGDCSTENTRMIRAIERRYLPACTYISTMSAVAAGRLRDMYDLPKLPTVLHNTPSLQERAGVSPPDQRPPSAIASLYWFGQTIGPHSCADHALRALHLMNQRARLVLRGNPDDAYVEHLRSVAHSLGLADRLEVTPRASPQDMVPLAAEHDIALCSQPSLEPFHQLAIGNKVFTGMMAGTALALTETIAHKELVHEAPGCGFLFPLDDAQSLAGELDRVLSRPDTLAAMKRQSFHLAGQQYNWECEGKRLLADVRERA